MGKTLTRQAFGEEFVFGVSASAYQIEGAHDADGKGPSIWDEFCTRKKAIYGGHTGNVACDFYHRYEHDLDLMRALQLRHFRLSTSWPRIQPAGHGTINQKGLDFYDRLIDQCLERDITPWVTLYHWDLPQALEAKGGWTNRNILHWFKDYVEIVVRTLGDRVQHWMVLNEPMVFTGAGYFLGLHAPGRRGLQHFIPAVHHASLCQAEGGRVIRYLQPHAQIGTTFSCSHVDPVNDAERHQQAAYKVDALLNRLFLEPSLGLPYPFETIPALQRIEQYMGANDENLLQFDFDFIGIQNYTREVVRHSWYTPYLAARLVKANKRNVPTTDMNWEVYPEAIYNLLKKYSAYPAIKNIYITENGAAFPDVVTQGHVFDPKRINYLKDHLQQVHRAKQEGVPVRGYFVWTFLDNFEWTEGYYPRFGLVHVNYKTQQRIIKASGEWYAKLVGAEELVGVRVSSAGY